MVGVSFGVIEFERTWFGGIFLLCNSGCVDEHVDFTEVVDDVLDGLAYGVGVSDIDAVEPCIDSGLFPKITSGFVTDFLLDVQNGDAADTHFRECLGHVETEATPSSAIDRQQCLRVG